MQVSNFAIKMADLPVEPVSPIKILGACSLSRVSASPKARVVRVHSQNLALPRELTVIPAKKLCLLKHLQLATGPVLALSYNLVVQPPSSELWTIHHIGGLLTP